MFSTFKYTFIHSGLNPASPQVLALSFPHPVGSCKLHQPLFVEGHSLKNFWLLDLKLIAIQSSWKKYLKRINTLNTTAPLPFNIFQPVICYENLSSFRTNSQVNSLPTLLVQKCIVTTGANERSLQHVCRAILHVRTMSHNIWEMSELT